MQAVPALVCAPPPTALACSRTNRASVADPIRKAIVFDPPVRRVTLSPLILVVVGGPISTMGSGAAAACICGFSVRVRWITTTVTEWGNTFRDKAFSSAAHN